MELWEDTDGNGNFTTAGDTRIAFSTVTGDGSGGWATLDPASNLSVGETWAKEYYIVFDISSSAPGWHYVGTYMPDSTYVTLVGSDTVTNQHFPHGVDCDQPLPVVLTSFDAYPGDGRVTLKWRTETELNSIRWIIERSASERGEYKTKGYAEAQDSVTYPTNYEFTDRDVKNGVTYWYKLTVECMDGSESYGPVSATPSDKIPVGPSAILKICPNPFKGTTEIEYSITENCHVSLNIYDFTGRVIRTLVDADKSLGRYSASWDGRDSDGREVTAGAYLCLISSNGYSCTKKIMLLK